MKRPDVSIEERVTRVVLQRVKRAPKPAEIGPETPLLGRALGLDSVDLFDLVISLEQEFGISLDESELSIEVFENIASLANHVKERCSKT